MKKTLIPLLLLSLLLSACGGPAALPTASAQPAPHLVIAATTYPVYLFTRGVCEGIDGVKVAQVVSAPVSCLHDYTLTVRDMKVIERAGLIAINGAGLEAAWGDAFSSHAVIDCSQDVPLLPLSGEEHGHGGRADEDEEYDPHIWLDPERAARMVLNLGEGLAGHDEQNAARYRQNASFLAAAFLDAKVAFRQRLDRLSCRELVTFHDGFRYFADAFSLTILRSIEEEAGSEASAKEVNEIIALVKEHALPAVFTEVNGARATADAIARETGVSIAELSTLISPPEDTSHTGYLSLMEANVAALEAALGTAP